MGTVAVLARSPGLSCRNGDVVYVRGGAGKTPLPTLEAQVIEWLEVLLDGAEAIVLLPSREDRGLGWGALAVR